MGKFFAIGFFRGLAHFFDLSFIELLLWIIGIGIGIVAVCFVFGLIGTMFGWLIDKIC